MSQRLNAQIEGSTLSRLRQAARGLFVERGYHETRPQDIAREAGVANGTFYLHFADKQQAFLDFAEQAQSELLSLMGERLQSIEGRRERWQVTCAALLEFDDVYPGLLQAAFIDPVFVAPQDDEAWLVYDRLGHVIGLAMQEEHTDFDRELISHGLCGFLRHAMIYASRRDLDRTQMIRDVSNFIDRALRN